MSAPGYPFAAIVGQPRLKLALLLAAVDWRLSVLLKGDKGSGKSTAARGLAEILPADAPFVNLPIGTTEDRLLGGLNLDHALQGKARLKSGLIQEAHGGVLYIDEVNLLSDVLTDALLDVASSGQHYIERDGFSASAEARFVLLGSMNSEEGALRPQLLDRFALALDVEAPAAAEDRALVLQEHMRFDRDPAAFRAGFEGEQQRLREAILGARANAPGIQPSPEILIAISQAITAAGVRSLRADLAALRAAVAHAALDGRAKVMQQDIESVLPLVLHHRVKRSPSPPPPPPPASRPPRKQERQMPDDAGRANMDRIFPPDTGVSPELRVHLAGSIARGRSAAVQDAGGAAAAQPGASPIGEQFDAAASLTASFRKTGAALLERNHLVFRAPELRSGLRFIFVVDASGSHAVQQRMRAVKGAALALIVSSVDHRDEVAVVAFRGPAAQVVLEPCRDADAALRALEFLPTGGRTPLAHALELANSLVTPASILILLTDGHANVALGEGDAWNDALQAARKLNCPSILVDSSADIENGAIQALSEAMRAQLIRLDDFSDTALLRIANSSTTTATSTGGSA